MEFWLIIRVELKKINVNTRITPYSSWCNFRCYRWQKRKHTFL